MSDVLISMICSQLGIPNDVVSELKATKVDLFSAGFDEGYANLTLTVKQPKDTFPVYLRIPVEVLQRIPSVYKKAVQLANT